MKGTWGRRVFGTVIRGAKYTRFHLEVELKNGLVASRTRLVSNLELDRADVIYGFVLDKMTAELDEQIKARCQEWVRQ